VSITDIIAKKRDGRELSRDEIAAMVDGFVRGEVSEGQMAALLMAITLNGMGERESADLTTAMVGSGERLDLSAIPGAKVDKHSTGGVGDKTTLVVAPLAAVLGVRVPKMSGRALGHTGGTIDKLETVPGLITDLSPERFCAQLSEIGVAIAAQSARMAPADKLIYALRDTTATVESIPLIASSVMSKKLAVGADAIVLDVKAGSGAFMQDEEWACVLAQTMVDIGVRWGKRMVALVTRMDQPLGAAVGDAVELAEAVVTLAGRGPADLAELCEALAGHMLALGGAAGDLAEGRARARQGLASGAGLGKLRQLVAAQGGSPEFLDRIGTLTEQVEQYPVCAAESGVIVGLEAREIGLAVRDLKAACPGAAHLCGVVLSKKVGVGVTRGEKVASVLVPPPAGAESAVQRVQAAYRIGDSAVGSRDLVVATISA